MVLVKPATVVQWHRKGFRLYWWWRSRRPGRPKIGREIRDLIRRMSKANPLWERPASNGELLKLGIKISQATVGSMDAVASQGPLPDLADLSAKSPARHCGDRHVRGCHCDVPAPLCLDCAQPDCRRVVHFEVTQNPTQVWLSGQMTEAFPWDTAPRYLLRDRDKSYGPAFRYEFERWTYGGHHGAAITLANPYAERLIGSIRRECLDHVIILNERHLRRVLSSYLQYHGQRTSRSTRIARGLVACNLPPRQYYCLPRGRRYASSL